MINKEGASLVITIGDIMTREVVSVSPGTSIEKIISIFTEKNFDGLPVVNEDGVLAGIITQYDLVTKGSGIHIPTLFKTLENVKMVGQEKIVLEGTLAPIKKLTAKDIMNAEPLTVSANDSIEQAVLQFAEHHKVNPIIVVDGENKMAGVISRHDLIKILAMKELGKTVDAAVERTRAAGGAEEAVSGAMKSVKKEFLFMPKYGARKWIVLGLAIFVIGIIASFLFIVKLPSGVQSNVPYVTTVPKGQGAVLSLVASSSILSLNKEFILTVELSANSDIEAKEVSASVHYDPNFVDFLIPVKDISSNWKSSVQLLDTKGYQILTVWSSDAAQTIKKGQKIMLGTLMFRTAGAGMARFSLDFKGPRVSSRSSVSDISGNNILDEVEAASVNIVQ